MFLHHTSVNAFRFYVFLFYSPLPCPTPCGTPALGIHSEQSAHVYHGVQLHLFAVQLHRVLTVGAVKAGVSRGADALPVSGPAGGAVQTLALKSAVLAVQTLRACCRQFVRQ